MLRRDTRFEGVSIHLDTGKTFKSFKSPLFETLVKLLEFKYTLWIVKSFEWQPCSHQLSASFTNKNEAPRPKTCS